jgi:hypothetical protein
MQAPTPGQPLSPFPSNATETFGAKYAAASAGPSYTAKSTVAPLAPRQHAASDDLQL